MLEETHTVSVNRKILRTKGWRSQNIWEEDVFNRQSILTDFDQEKLFSIKIGEIGCGGIGTHYSLLLARAGCGYQEICDMDLVELTNLNRQLFYLEQINMNKAIAWLDILKNECTAPATLIGYPFKFPDVLEVHPNAYSTVDLLACLVDNHKARFEAALFGLKHNVPVIFAGISRDMKCASVFVQEPNGPCFGCFKPPGDIERLDEKNECVDPAVIDIHAGIVGIAVRATLSLIMGWELPWNYFYLALEGQGRSGQLKERPDCEICGERE